MPHFIVECTENIREEARLPELFASVNTALAATGIFPLGEYVAGRTGSIRQMADGKHDYAFVHMTLKSAAAQPGKPSGSGRNAV